MRRRPDYWRRGLTRERHCPVHGWNSGTPPAYSQNEDIGTRHRATFSPRQCRELVVDMRVLAQLLAHVHDAEIEIEVGSGPPPCDRPLQ
jgi:hypothetical protein